MRRAGLALLAMLLLLPVAAVLGGGAVLDSASVRMRLIDAVQRSTGHALRIDGPIRLAWSLTPAIEARQIVLLNPSGFSRTELASAQRVEGRLALLPLLRGRLEVPEIVVEQADVLLERDGAGRGNWQVPAAAPPSPSPDTAPAPQPRRPVQVGRVLLTNGRLAWLNGPALTVGSLELAPTGGPVLGTVALDGVPFTIGGHWADAGAGEVTASGAGLALSVSRQPGADVVVQALVPELRALEPLAKRTLPPLRDVRVSAWVGPAGWRGLHLTAGGADLGATWPGLRLVQLDVTAADAGQPVKALAQAAAGSLPVAAAVSVGSVAALIGQGPIPFQLVMEADGAAVSAQGSADRTGRGLEATLSVRAPDLRRTGALAGLAWPGLHDAALDVRVLPAPGGAGVLARGVRLTSAEGDLAGDLALGFGLRPSLRGSIVSQRLDLDAWLAGPPAPSPASAAPSAPTLAPVLAPAPLASASPALPFAALLRADADLQLGIAQAVFRGAAYRAIEARLLLQDGRLRLDPLRLETPGGGVQGQLLADAAATPPTAALTLRAQALDAALLAAALGAGGAASGTIDLDVRLRSAGADWGAMAVALDGHAGLALIDGDVENQMLAALFGPVLRAANLPVDVSGRSRVRCLAWRADAAAGTLALRALALDAARVRLDGEGTMDLANQTVDLHLRPTIRIGGTGIAVPVHLTGPVRAPAAALERGAISPGRIGLSIGGGAPDPCGPALAAARDGRAGAMPR